MTGWPESTASLDPACASLYKRKDQCAQVALAFDNVVGARVAFDRGEGEREVQPSELGLDSGDVFLQQRSEAAQLLADPLGKVPDLELLRSVG